MTVGADTTPAPGGAGDAEAAGSAHPFDGPGELRARCRALDWAATSLGPVERWPTSLRTVAALVLAAPTPMILLWGDALVQLYNDGYRDVMGAKHPGGLGQRNRECWPEVWDFTGPIYDGVRQRGESFTFVDQHLVLDRPGLPSDAYFTLTYMPVRDDAGAVGGVLVTVFETTAQVRARGADAAEREQLLVESERARSESDSARARSEAVLSSIADAFYLLDRQWRFTYVNDAAEPLLQTTRERLLGRTLWEAFPDVAGSVFEGPYREAMATGRVTSAEAYFAPLGTWFDVRTYPWSGGLMVHFRDVGARVAAEAERDRLLAAAQAARAEAEAAREAAETANRAKSEFLAVMSHELRTPLNAIGGYAELLELGIHGPVTTAQRQALARIQQSQRHLLGLINQVLNYTRIDAGVVRYELGDVQVSEALSIAEALVLPQVRARGLTYVIGSCPPGLVVRADRDKLQQVLLNLLTNAIKFTEPGGEVRVSCRETADAVAIAVADTGIGIAPEKLASIFEPFVQIDQRHTRAHEGVGLGLAISRDLARGMGGDLVATSVPGDGSVFTLTVPRAPAPSPRRRRRGARHRSDERR